MILEAFSSHLKEHLRPGQAPERILAEWLMARLLLQKTTQTMIEKVLHAEIELVHLNGHYFFEGKSDTGRELLKSLTQYCRSYDHWQFSRWVHELRASDFNQQHYGS